MTKNQLPPDVDGAQDRSERSRSAGGRSRAEDDSRLLATPEPLWRAPTNQLAVPSDPRYEWRWVAEYVVGFNLAMAVHSRIREGYERVRVTELPEDFVFIDSKPLEDGFVRYGGFILMRLPIAAYRQRQAYYAARSKERLDAVNELQGVAGRNAVKEDRGSRTLTGEDARRALMEMNQT